MVIQDVPRSEKLFIEEDFISHTGVDSDSYDAAHRDFGYRE